MQNRAHEQQLIKELKDIYKNIIKPERKTRVAYISALNKYLFNPLQAHSPETIRHLETLHAALIELKNLEDFNNLIVDPKASNPYTDHLVAELIDQLAENLIEISLHLKVDDIKINSMFFNGTSGPIGSLDWYIDNQFKSELHEFPSNCKLTAATVGMSVILVATIAALLVSAAAISVLPALIVFSAGLALAAGAAIATYKVKQSFFSPQKPESAKDQIINKNPSIKHALANAGNLILWKRNNEASNDKGFSKTIELARKLAKQ